MSAISATTADGLHVSTGHGESPEGVVHEPEWGPWMPEWAGLELRQCQHWDCDADDVRRVQT